MNACGSIACADESCRWQRLSHCSRKCNADSIGGCGCPPGRAVCEGLCCRPGEVCTLTGCSPPNQVCNNRGSCLGRCLPDGCCPPHRIVYNNLCCAFGVRTCAPDGNCVGCGDEGQPPCGMACRGDLHLNIDMLSNRLLCTASCGHHHQHACRTTCPFPAVYDRVIAASSARVFLRQARPILLIASVCRTRSMIAKMMFRMIAAFASLHPPLMATLPIRRIARVPIAPANTKAKSQAREPATVTGNRQLCLQGKDTPVGLFQRC